MHPRTGTGRRPQGQLLHKTQRLARFLLSGGDTVGELDSVLSVLPDDGLHGRRVIYTDVPEITPENVVDVVGKALSVHRLNRNEIQYLWDYYRGKQDIRCRVKEVRPEINNKVTVNRANEIVAFKVSYLLSDGIQYVSLGSDESVSNKVNELNKFMYAEDKAAKDKSVTDWAHICGVGVRMVLPDPVGEEDGSPVCIYPLDPREAFVIYYSGLGQKPVAGVIRQRDEKGQWYSIVYTTQWYFEIKNGKITKQETRTVPYVPVIEYLHNEARMGAFEVVLPLLNAINTLESNRVDDIEQFVQSILVFINCELTEEQGQSLREKLGLMIKSDPTNPADVKRIEGELSQGGAQTLVDDLYDSVLTITGMPNRNGGSSTSDTGAATIMRDGWQSAESRAKDTELLFKRAEREMLRVVLYILRESGTLDLNWSDVDPKFLRHNNTDLQSKVQVLCEMLNNPKIHPKLAFQASGMFSDAEESYRMSMEWYEKQQAEMEQSLRREVDADNGQSVLPGRSSGGTSEQESNQAVRGGAE